MNRKVIGCVLAVAIVISGCTSGIYTGSVSVAARDDGVKDFTVVRTLDFKRYPESMPVVVEKVDWKRDQATCTTNTLGGLSILTLTIIPLWEKQSITHVVEVRTPLGEKRGWFTVEAKQWTGWLPMFLPYSEPGDASARFVARETKDESRKYLMEFPVEALELKYHDELVANLVSQFSLEEYEKFLKMTNSK